jgi:uncharacterized alkaline shock family protein YloU
MALERQLGDISIDNSVVGTIAAIAAQEVEGIVTKGGKFSITEMLRGKESDRGVKVQIEGNSAVIAVDIKIEYGRNMYDAAHDLQRKVKDNVEQMTGLVVDKVNVKINGIIMNEKKDKAPQEG